ncbi:acyl-CoA dehydrogenase family protein [Alteriqipengyuania sp. 357]
MPEDAHLEMVASVIAKRAGEADVHDGELSNEIELLRSDGWLAACLPRSRGGEGWGTEPEGTRPAFDALRALGRANLSVARLFEGHMNAVKLLHLYGSDSLSEAAFADVADGELLGVWGADDPAAPFGFVERDDRLHLRGGKRFASGLGLVGQAVVTAQDEAGLRLLLLPTKDLARADFSAWAMDGMRATQSGRYDFGGESVSAERTFGKPGDYLREPFFEGGIWRYCTAHLGAGEALFGLMRDVLVARGRADDPHQQRRIVEGAIAIETPRLWLQRAADAVEAANADPDAAILSLLAREVTETCCRDVLRIVEQALGMGAHQAGTAVERIARDLRLFLCQAAPDAKRARAAEALIARGTTAEFL